MARYYVIRYYAGRNKVSGPTILVLASLAEGEKHGYAMMEDIQQFAGIRLGPGTLYGAITRLEERGWIRPVQSRDRRQPYCITAAGKRHLEEQVAALGQIVKTAARRLHPA
jgi:DNA-binding PadR family transcriptional regulator